MSIRRNLIIGLLAACLLAPLTGQPAAAKSKKRIWPGPYPATVVKVVDGDTLRVVARLMLLTEQGELDLGQLLIARHLAVPYFGGRKADWCAILRQQAQQQEGGQ